MKMKKIFKKHAAEFSVLALPIVLMAFFAIIKEFSDKVDFTENVADEWFRLYAENYPIVWPGTYQGMAVANSAFAAWNDMMETLLDCNSRCAVLQQL